MFNSGFTKKSVKLTTIYLQLSNPGPGFMWWLINQGSFGGVLWKPLNVVLKRHMNRSPAQLNLPPHSHQRHSNKKCPLSHGHGWDSKRHSHNQLETEFELFCHDDTYKELISMILSVTPNFSSTAKTLKYRATNQSKLQSFGQLTAETESESESTRLKVADNLIVDIVIDKPKIDSQISPEMSKLFVYTRKTGLSTFHFHWRTIPAATPYNAYISCTSMYTHVYTYL